MVATTGLDEARVDRYLLQPSAAAPTEAGHLGAFAAMALSDAPSDGSTASGAKSRFVIANHGRDDRPETAWREQAPTACAMGATPKVAL
ncbi:MAG: hypothetical protein ACR2H3_03260 [Acidimicrobiales bacterium]